jgi:IS1 family transposase
MLPLHVGEISHTLDLLQLRSQCKGLFASDIYEIASRLLIENASDQHLTNPKCLHEAFPIKASDSPEIGDQYVFVAIDEETKLVPAFFVGKRTRHDTTAFLWDLYKRLAVPTQLTTDGLIHYTAMVPMCFGLDVDFAQLVKLYDHGQFDSPEGRYSPSPIAEVISKARLGDPGPDHISTSFVERQNLTMRMAMRRFTRLTNAFSKKLSHLKAATALHFAYYNFCRVHSSLRITPAMEAALTDHVWSINELLFQQHAI